MKKISILIIFLFSISIVSASCLTSSESFASEVVVENYNLFNLNKLANAQGNKFIMQSQFDPKILTIIQETEFPPGLSVKLQIPTESNEITKPHLKILSNPIPGEIKKNLANSFGGWQINCQDSQCEFTKDNLIISAEEFNNQKEITLEINEELNECSDTCSGVCLDTITSSKCLSQKQLLDLNNILKISNISNSFEDILSSYRVIGSQEIINLDIKPQFSPFINWQEALRQELVFLNKNEIIELKREDIESIASLAKRGQAGQNYRIVHDLKENSWNYYDKISNPILTNQRDCTIYESLDIQDVIKEKPKNKVFYLVPTIAAISGILIIILLTLIARLINRKKN